MVGTKNPKSGQREFKIAVRIGVDMLSSTSRPLLSNSTLLIDLFISIFRNFVAPKDLAVGSIKVVARMYLPLFKNMLEVECEEGEAFDDFLAGVMQDKLDQQATYMTLELVYRVFTRGGPPSFTNQSNSIYDGKEESKSE